jgi:phage shock protein A
VDIGVIRTRRAALATQAAEAQQHYAELEATSRELEATLRELDRQICAMHGGLQELDALLADVPAAAEGSP